MAVPKQRQTSGRGKRRRGGHQSLKKTNLVKCTNCNQSIPSHKVCSYCGHYKGREVVDVTKGIKDKPKK
jgi:large subunit ribosomal protein L32